VTTGFELLVVQWQKVVASIPVEQHSTSLIEHRLKATTPGAVTTKPVDLLAEGLVSINSRGDWI
jgi:hypothetical protein